MSEYGDDIGRVLIAKIEGYNEERNPKYIEQIKEIMAEAKQVGNDSGSIARKNAMLLNMLFNEKADQRIRYLLEGHTEAEYEKFLAVENEKARKLEEQRQQWRAQGLCASCGGQLGMFKKCKSCGAKN
jgi:uncharacterized protein (UPF0335 family)